MITARLCLKFVVISFTLLSSFLSFNVLGAESVPLMVESILSAGQESNLVLPYAINLASYPSPPKKAQIPQFQRLNSQFLYITRVRISGKRYYRLVLGNYASADAAIGQLAKVKNWFPGAWVNRRKPSEIEQLKRLLNKHKQPSATIAAAVVSPPAKILKKISVTPGNVSFAEKLLKQSRQLLLDKNYARLIQVSDKIVEIGLPEQKQQALEFAGIARERQRKFSQAAAIYRQFLAQYPDSKIAPRIKSRLQGLTTMSLEPKAKLVSRKSKRRIKDESWDLTGSVAQYYRDNIVDTTSQDTQTVNSSLLTDLSLFARKKTGNNTLSLRFDGGLVNDFLDNSNSSDVSRAMVRYINGDSAYEIIGGRQTRTAKGVLGRFDGVVLNLTGNPDITYSLYAGFPVASSSDGFDSSRRFIGGSINIKPLDKMEMDIYLMQQNIDGLTDRQAIGSEMQYRSDKGFVYGIIDYDIFYDDLNSLTAIGNYRYSDALVLNMTLDYRNSPWLTTLNAIQGQTVATIGDLKNLFSDKEIYQFAQDRTSKSKSFFIGANYQIDKIHQFDISTTVSSIDATAASGGVDATPASDDYNLLATYSIDGFFQANDFTSFGTSLSDTSSSRSLSLRFRSRFMGSKKGLRYDPRLQLDYRDSKTSNTSQWILKPSFKVKYKHSRHLNFEASVGVDYSNYNLPELNDQTSYNLFMGYNYYF